jgi:sugar/nucleoside kinase (ribokinase family)
MFDVVTIGSTTRDAFYDINLESVRWPKAKSGRAYVLPAGDKLEVKGIYFTIGGNSANSAVTFARQGFKTACAAKVGADVAGEEIRRRLKKENVDTSMIKNHPTLPTAYSVLIREKGERTILAYHGASDSFSLSDLRPAEMRAKWWYVSLAGESDKMLLPLLKFARKDKIAVAFNPSGHHLRHKKGDVLRSLKDISFLVLNDEEASILTGVSWRNEAAVFKRLDKLMPGILAVTEGRKGVTVSDGRFVYKAGIFKEKKLVDRTGAGDAFGSGFVAGLMRRGVNLRNIPKIKPADIIYAIRLASANATSVVEKVGATEGALRKEEFSERRWKNLKITARKLK